MVKWKVVKSVHQFIEEDPPRKFIEANVFVTPSKRDAFRQFALHLCEAEIFSDSHYCFSRGEIIYKCKSPTCFHVYHIELWRNDELYSGLTDKEAMLIEKFRLTT